MIKLRRWYIEVNADWFMDLYCKVTGKKGYMSYKAGACFPFIFTTSKIDNNLREYFMNHERIHIIQQAEKLVIGAWLFYLLGFIYYRLIKQKLPIEGYLLQPHEQEAYDNMFNLDYLKTRPVFNDLRKYIKRKPVTWSTYMKKSFEFDGFKEVYEWYDEPNTIYEEHMHKGKVSIYIAEGSVTFSGGINRTLVKYDSFDVPINTLHSAKVGSEGCKYIVGQEIEGDA
jgi:hypothetical protein